MRLSTLERKRAHPCALSAPYGNPNDAFSMPNRLTVFAVRVGGTALAVALGALVLGFATALKAVFALVLKAVGVTGRIAK